MFRTSEAIDNKFWNKENKRKVQRKKQKKVWSVMSCNPLEWNIKYKNKFYELFSLQYLLSFLSRTENVWHCSWNRHDQTKSFQFILFPKFDLIRCEKRRCVCKAVRWGTRLYWPSCSCWECFLYVSNILTLKAHFTIHCRPIVTS